MKKVCFLINQVESFKMTNCLLLTNALIERGDQVWLCFIDSLALLHSDTLAGRAQIVEGQLEPGHLLSECSFELKNLAEFDYVWILGFGNQISFLDKIEMLWSLHGQTQIVNSIESLLFLHSKYHLGWLANVIKHPETYASADLELLWKVFKESGGTWVVKPPARSLGRDTFLLRQEDTNARVILQNMTGYNTGQFCIMQRYIPEIASGEKRVLIARGHVVGQYKRVANNDHRTNIHQGGIPSACDLTAEEAELCRQMSQYLVDVGAYFVGVDLVYPYVIELNVLSPGGIATIMELTGQNLAPQVVDRIIT